MTNFAGIAAILSALLIGNAGTSRALAADTGPRLIEFESPLAGPQALQGLLRLPDRPGPSPAVVLLHGCGGGWRGLDERWGKRLAEWGYVTLTVDRFGTRDIKNTCTSGLPPSNLHDAYRALNFLDGQSSVDPGSRCGSGIFARRHAGAALGGAGSGRTQRQKKNSAQRSASTRPASVSRAT